MGAVLRDALHRVSVLGGREGMPRSLGSVYGGAVTLFLGGSLRGVVRRVIATPLARSDYGGMAVSCDGCTVLVADYRGYIHEFSVADGSRRRVVPLQIPLPRQVWVAPDDFVFVADNQQKRVHVLTPHLDRAGVVGRAVGQPELDGPGGVCANADVVVVSQPRINQLTVLRRRDSTVLRQFGCKGVGDGQLHTPLGLCFMSAHRHVAVAEFENGRVSVFSVEGEFVRHVGVGMLRRPRAVASSAFDDLVIADSGNARVVVFSASGALYRVMGRSTFNAVAVHGGVVFARDHDSMTCVVFT